MNDKQENQEHAQPKLLPLVQSNSRGKKELFKI